MEGGDVSSAYLRETERTRLTDKSGFQLLSKTAMAARLPDPIVTYGSLSVDPCGWIVKSCGPVMSTPPRTSAAPMFP